MYTYTLTQWMLFFFTYCFFGWCIESTIVSVSKRRFINRGFLRIPMLPLYGSGAVLILFLTIPFKDSLPLVYLAGTLGATALEYVTGWGMEQLFKIKYWDYSTQKFQLHGRICLTSSLFWGVLSVALTEYIHPPIEKLILGLPAGFVSVSSILCFCIMLIDTIVSAKAALDLAKVLERLSRIRDEIEQLHTQLDELKDSAHQEISAAKEAAHLHIATVKDDVKEQHERIESLLHEPAEKLRSRLQELSALREDEMSHLGFLKSQLLKGSPSAYSKKFNGALRELKERLNK